MTSKDIHTILKGLPVFVWAYLGIVLLLAVASFVLPPLGIVHESVISTIWALFGGASIFLFVAALPDIIKTIIEKGGTVKTGIKISDTEASIEVTKKIED